MLIIVNKPTWVFSSGYDTIYVSDALTSLGRITIILSALFTRVQDLQTDEHSPFSSPEFNIFISSLVLGCVLAASSVNLVMLIVSVALLDLSLFFIISSEDNTGSKYDSNISFLTYLLISFSFLILGCAILYGLTGNVNYRGINNILSMDNYSPITLLMSILLIIAGFGLKIIIAPFHFTLRDIIKNSKVTTIALIIGPVFLGSLLVLARMFITIFNYRVPSLAQVMYFSTAGRLNWSMIVQLFTVITVCYFTISLFTQKNLKIIVLYSLAIQSALFLSGLSALTDSGFISSISVIITFTFISCGIFYLLNIIEKHFNTTDVNELTGAGRKNKWIFIPLMIFLLSLAGLPLTIGFSERILVYSSVQPYAQYWIVTISIIGSILMILFNFRLFIRLFLMEQTGEIESYNFSLGGKILLLITTLPAILAGIYFEPIVKMSEYFSKIYGI